MKKITKLKLVMFFLLLGNLISTGWAAPTLMSLQGFWIYGFEQSIIETCDGHKYWMWTPDEFNGRYESEGYSNPVKVTGYLLPPNPEKNMNSSFNELKVVAIRHIKKSC